MIRIAFVAEHYPPADGGVATSVQRVARELVRQGSEVQVLCFDCVAPIESQDAITVENDEGVLVKRVAPFFLKQKNVNADSLPEKVRATFRRRAVNQMIREVQNKPVDCVLSFYLLNAGFLAQFVARYFQIPFVAGVRGNDIGRNVFHVERFAVIQWVVQGADRIVCVNRHLRERLMLAFPNTENKSLVIPNAVPPLTPKATAQTARRRILHAAGWPEDSLILVFIGTLREKKGIMPLTKALNMFGDSRARLLVVGPDIGSIERRMCGAEWDSLFSSRKVYVTGAMSRTEVPDWAVGGDVVLMPSVEDGMANGLLEGMSLGLCPLVTDIFKDIVTHDDNGIIVPANDSKALAGAVQRLSASPELVTALGSRAATTIERYHRPATEASRYLQLLTELAHNGIRRRAGAPVPATYQG